MFSEQPVSGWEIPLAESEMSFEELRFIISPKQSDLEEAGRLQGVVIPGDMLDSVCTTQPLTSAPNNRTCPSGMWRKCFFSSSNLYIFIIKSHCKHNEFYCLYICIIALDAKRMHFILCASLCSAGSSPWPPPPIPNSTCLRKLTKRWGLPLSCARPGLQGISALVPIPALWLLLLLPRLTLGAWESPSDTSLIKSGLFWFSLILLIVSVEKPTNREPEILSTLDLVYALCWICILCASVYVLLCAVVENGGQKTTSKSRPLLSCQTWGPSYDLQTW